jgi:hypothetical protein
MVILARKNGKLEIIVPYLDGAGIPGSKAQLLVELARARYLAKCLKQGENISE